MGAPDSCGCRIRDNMMLLSLTLAAVASLASSESGISYTAEPFKADQQQLAHITYTAEPFKTEFKPINTNAAIQPFTTYASLPRTYTPINTLSSSSSSYSYTLPLSYNTLPGSPTSPCQCPSPLTLACPATLPTPISVPFPTTPSSTRPATLLPTPSPTPSRTPPATCNLLASSLQPTPTPLT